MTPVKCKFFKAASKKVKTSGIRRRVSLWNAYQLAEESAVDFYPEDAGNYFFSRSDGFYQPNYKELNGTRPKIYFNVQKYFSYTIYL